MMKSIFILILVIMTSIASIQCGKYETNINPMTINISKIDYKFSTDSSCCKTEVFKNINNKIEIYDVFGRKISTKSIGVGTINFHNISRGVYCLRIYKPDSVINKKIIIY